MYVGLYSAASGMIAQGINQDVIAQNLANASVGGFKKERMVFRSFPDILLSAVSPGAAAGDDPMRAAGHIGRVGTGTGLDWIYTVYENGQMKHTGEPTDVALMGDGFFTLQLHATGGTAYTRNGAFMLDEDGYLRTMEGDYVMGTRGRVRISEPDFPSTARATSPQRRSQRHSGQPDIVDFTIATC
ncbi:flagellar hook-basal body complex protein [bacterium]|nr:flagellar hook-basal body complex protein [bacterium]